MAVLSELKGRLLEPVFAGIDLAWGRKNPSGGAILCSGRLVAAVGTLTDDESILDFLAFHIPSDAPCVVAIDAPLRVPNTGGGRLCDRAVTSAYGARGAGALPANRSLPLFQPDVRGETLVRELAARLQIEETSAIARQDPRRLVCEVYPHPAHVELFELGRTLKYKVKPGRSRAELAGELSRYRALLGSLQEAQPALRGLEDLVPGEPAELRGRARKRLEDTLDAVTCAYVAAWAWEHGPQGQRWFGTLESGSILVPQRDQTATACAVAGEE